MPAPHAFAWRPASALLALSASLTALAQTPAPIAWTEAQVRAAGIRTEPVGQGAGDGARLQGTVVLPMSAIEVVSTPVAGVVQAVLVDLAQPLRAGQPVARVQSPQLVEWQRDWRLAQAQARLADDKRQRDEQLFNEGVVSEGRLRESRTQAELARLTLSEKRMALQMAGLNPSERLAASEFTPLLTVTSRLAGAVLELLVSPGQRLEAGAPLAKVARAGQLAIELQATAEQAATARPGDRLRIDGCASPARLVSVAPQLSGTTQSRLLRALPTGPASEQAACLRPNQFVLAQLLGAAPAAGLSVPAAAVVQHEGQAHVFVARGGQFVPTPVALGAGAERRPVRSGLKAGDAVVVQGTAALKGAWLGLGAEAAGGQAPKGP